MNTITNPVDFTAAAPAGTTNTASSAAAAGASTLNGNDFMTLLVAQLKNQDPTNPMDPTQFVSQLVQFNSLEQLIGIKQDLDTAAASATPTAATSTTAGTSSTGSTSPGTTAAGTNPSNPSTSTSA